MEHLGCARQYNFTSKCSMKQSSMIINQRFFNWPYAKDMNTRIASDLLPSVPPVHPSPPFLNQLPK